MLNFSIILKSYTFSTDNGFPVTKQSRPDHLVQYDYFSIVLFIMQETLLFLWNFLECQKEIAATLQQMSSLHWTVRTSQRSSFMW